MARFDVNTLKLIQCANELVVKEKNGVKPISKCSDSKEVNTFLVYDDENYVEEFSSGNKIYSIVLHACFSVDETKIMDYYNVDGQKFTLEKFNIHDSIGYIIKFDLDNRNSLFITKEGWEIN